MRTRPAVGLLASAGLAATGCELLFPPSGGATVDASAPPDAVPGPPDARYPTGPFGPQTVHVLGLANPRQPSLTADMLEVYVAAGGAIYRATRPDTGSLWEPAAMVGELDAPGVDDNTPSVSGDGRLIYFSSQRAGGAGNYDLWWSTRPMRQDVWAPPQLAPGLNTLYGDSGASVSDNDRHVVFESDRPDGGGTDFDLYVSQRAAPGVAWDPPELLGAAPLVSSALDARPLLSPDRLTLYFYSGRDGGNDLYVATRAMADLPFDPPRPIDELNTADQESAPWVSPDGHHIFFIRGPIASSQLMSASR